MRTALTIFRKEFRDTIRDRRTIMAMIVIPLLGFPLIMGFVVRLTVSQVQKAEARKITIALVANAQGERLRELAMARGDLTIREDVAADEIRALIESKTIDGAVVVAPGFDESIAALRQGAVSIYYKSTKELDLAEERLQDLLQDYKKELVRNRLLSLQLEESAIEPLAISEVNVASLKEMLGGKIGGFLPYIVILFCFTGIMYPAIDLGAGEKERGTLETLLTSPASFGQILTGKFGVTILAGLISAGLSVAGLYFAVRMVKALPKEMMDAIMNLLEPGSIALFLSLILPLCVFFSAIQLSLSFMAKSFKEAQSLINPIIMFLIIPAIIGTIPGFEFGYTTAVIPIVNVSLASKAILAGTIKTGPLVVAYVSLFVLAAVTLAIAARWINRESTIFRD